MASSNNSTAIRAFSPKQSFFQNSLFGVFKSKPHQNVPYKPSFKHDYFKSSDFDKNKHKSPHNKNYPSKSQLIQLQKFSLFPINNNLQQHSQQYFQLHEIPIPAHPLIKNSQSRVSTNKISPRLARKIACYQTTIQTCSPVNQRHQEMVIPPVQEISMRSSLSMGKICPATMV